MSIKHSMYKTFWLIKHKKAILGQARCRPAVDSAPHSSSSFRESSMGGKKGDGEGCALITEN